MAEKNGVLSAFGVKEFEDLKSGFQRTNPALGSRGPSSQNVAGALTSLATMGKKASPIGALYTGMNAFNNLAAEKAAGASLGRSPVYSAAILGDTIQGALTNNMSPSSMSMARSAADTNQDGRVSVEEANAYGMGKGLTAYDIGTDMNLPNVNMNRAFSARQMRDNPPVVSNLSPTSPANPANYANKDYGPAYSSTAPSTINTVKDNLGIGQSSLTTTDAGMSKPTTAEMPTAPKEADSPSTGTYICTVLFEEGDMSRSVYKYDKLYGTIVDSNIFDGYAVWGQPLANLMKRNKIVYKIAKPIALSWANQMAYDKSNAFCGRKSITGKLVKYIGEPLCYAIGFVINRRRKWLKST